MMRSYSSIVVVVIIESNQHVRVICYVLLHVLREENLYNVKKKEKIDEKHHFFELSRAELMMKIISSRLPSSFIRHIHPMFSFRDA